MISLPPHLEADLTDYVEGVALPADRAEAVARALAQSPELAALVGGMKGDRAALQGLGTEPAPAGLLAQVESVLEREMLLGAATLESAAPSAIPLSKVRPLRPASGLFSARNTRWAVAAGLLLAASGGVLLWQGGGRQPSSGSSPIGGRDLAMTKDRADRPAPPVPLTGSAGPDREGLKRGATNNADASSPPPAPAIAESDATLKFAPDDARERFAGIDKSVASGTTVSAAPEMPGGSSLPRGLDRAMHQNISNRDLLDNDAGEHPIEAAAGGEQRDLGRDAASPEISADDLTALALQGRLALLVKSDAPEQAREQLLASARRSAATLDPSALDGPAVLAALAPALQEDLSPVRLAASSDDRVRKIEAGAAEASAPAPRGTASVTPTTAPASGLPASTIVPPASPPVSAGAAVPPPVAFRLIAPASGLTLGRLVSGTTSAKHRVRWVVLDAERAFRDPLVSSVAQPADLLWWTTPPGTWVQHVYLPVVIQPGR